MPCSQGRRILGLAEMDDGREDLRWLGDLGIVAFSRAESQLNVSYTCSYAKSKEEE